MYVLHIVCIRQFLAVVKGLQYVLRTYYVLHIVLGIRGNT
jgi:hypothetical protein